MLQQITERIDALGPRFRDARKVVCAVEAQSGVKGALAFAKEHHDGDVKAISCLLIASDWETSIKRLSEWIIATSVRPQQTRKANRLLRLFERSLAEALARPDG